MTERKSPPRGASRAPRRKTGSDVNGRSQPARKAGSRSAPKKAASRIRKGWLILALTLTAVIVAVLWMLKTHPHKAVDTVPAALAEEPKRSAKAEAADAAEEAADAAHKKQLERFDFYEILPKQSVLPTRDLSTPKTPVRTLTPPGTDTPTTLGWLQVGAFAHGEEAEQRRKSISQLSLPARVQEGSDGQGTRLFRVLAGPFKNETTLGSARSALAAAGLDAIPASNPPALTSEK